MDILTQGVIGAALPLATRHKKQAAAAAALGFLAGLAPDFDALIRSSQDPLMFLEFHRHFTHSLFFIPVGSAAVAGVLYGLGRRWLRFSIWKCWFFCALGFGTHGLLDAATSFGTSLLWPLSDSRFSLSIISIFHPLFTLPLIALVGAGVLKRDGRYGRGALLWAALYLSAAGYQHLQARGMAETLAESRGHGDVRLVVKPTFGNILLWRSVYAFGGRFYVDAVRPWPYRQLLEGTSIATLAPARDFLWLQPDSRQARDIMRFARLSEGYVAKAPDGSARVFDVRYSFLPTETTPLWFIRLSPYGPPGTRAVYATDRTGARDKLATLFEMITSTP